MQRTSRLELEELLRSLGLNRGDRVFVHAFVPSLGLVEGGLAGVSDALRAVIGDEGTLIVPTFSASYRRGEVYDVAGSPSFNGALSEYVRRRPAAIRNLDPLFSFAAIGPDAADLMRRDGKNCFGAGSGYDRLFAANVKFIGLGVHWDQGYSFMMHLERLAEVPFRVEQRFDGVTRDSGGAEFPDWAIHFVRDEAQPVRRNRGPLGQALVDEGVAIERHLHGVPHRCLPAAATAARVVTALRADPYCMAVRP